MNKIWISFNFYLLAVINIIAIQNPISMLMIVAIILDAVFLPIIKSIPNSQLYDIMGITWLQKKFKNSELIMDMTNE